VNRGVNRVNRGEPAVQRKNLDLFIFLFTFGPVMTKMKHTKQAKKCFPRREKL